MSASLRLFLIAGALVTLIFFITRIRKSKLKINHAIYWMVFSLLMLFLALVPESITGISRLLGFQAPVNLVYVVVIALLVLKLFTNTMKLSKLSEQVAALTQTVAIYQLEATEKKESKEETVV